MIVGTEGRRIGTEQGAEHPEFEALFDAQSERLVRLAGLICRDQRLAEDAVAEVFARLFRRWPVTVENPDAYLRKAVINELAGVFRRTGRRRRTLARLPAPVFGSLGDDSLAERDRLWRALGQLPRQQRAALVLRYFEDLSEADTASILGVPVGTVKSSVSRGLDKLRRSLEGEGS